MPRPVLTSSSWFRSGCVAGGPRFEDQVLSPLLSGGDSQYEVRDWENDEVGTSLNASMTTERQFLATDVTPTNADLRVNGNSDIPHDPECEVVMLD